MRLRIAQDVHVREIVPHYHDVHAEQLAYTVPLSAKEQTLYTNVRFER